IENVKEEIARTEAEKAQAEQSDESNAVQNSDSYTDTKPSDTPRYEAVEDETTPSASNLEEI
ncbi:MAG: hypothetical protein PVJ50_10640, partial [Desulfobacterales bacterium]